MTQALEDVKDIGSLQVLQSVESDKIRIELRERFWLLYVISNKYDYLLSLLIWYYGLNYCLLVDFLRRQVVLTLNSLKAAQVTCLFILRNLWCFGLQLLCVQ